MPPVIFGVAFGNLLQGVPFQFDSYLISTYTGSFWQLLNPFALLAGVVSSAMITLQGATYLAHRTEGVVHTRTVTAGTGAGLLMVIGFIAAGVWLQSIDGYRISSLIDPATLPNPLEKTVVREAGAWMANYAALPLLWLLPRASGVVGALAAVVLMRRGRTLTAFVASSLATTRRHWHRRGQHVPLHHASSTMPAASLTVWDSVSSTSRWGSCSGPRCSSCRSSWCTRRGPTASCAAKSRRPTSARTSTGPIEMVRLRRFARRFA